MSRPNASRADIITMLRDGHSNSRIARELHVDKHRVQSIRNELGLPPFVPAEQTRTLEEKWALYTQPLSGGHLKWTGTRGTASGTPLLSYKEHVYTAATIAFTIKHGRQPNGQVKADCGMHHCVAPDHVDDGAGRLAKRAEIRRAAGWGERPETCPAGHDQSIEGRLGSLGEPYCEACKREWKREPETAKASRRAAKDSVRQEMDALLRQGLPQIQIARQLKVAWKTVQRRREALGLPAPRPGRLTGHGSPEEVFAANTERLDGGHLRWTGYVSGTGAAYVCYRQERITPATLAFRMRFGRMPVGRVRPGCGMDGCVEGSHLEDRQIRDANERADSAFDVIFGRAS
jgi:transposase-like protein